MIKFQIVERSGTNLFKTLTKAFQAGEFKTFFTSKRGRKVQHVSKSHPGWINWNNSNGIILCELVNPQKPGLDWKLLNAFIGRLTDKYIEDIQCINIQFQSEPSKKIKGK